jgi:hypothetical protein
MTQPRSSLARWQPQQPADDAHIRAMAGAAWHQPRPWVCLPLDEIEDDWERMAMVRIMTRRHGKRRG